MTLEERFTRLLEKQREAETLPFLQTLTEEERRQLAPHLKKLRKEYFTYQQQGTTWQIKATDKQRNVLNYAFVVCFNANEIKKENPVWLLSREHLEKFLSWFSPPWLNNYVNGFSESEWLPFQLDYGYLMELAHRGFVQPHPRLAARLLVGYIYQRKDQNSVFVPQNVLQHPETLAEHIWYLFQYETDIPYSNRYLYFNGKKLPDETGWPAVFRQYAAEGKIDRLRLLKETLLAGNRNFNKTLSGWFAELFVQLKPSREETLAVQPELFVLFSSPHSKVVNTALQACKELCDDPGFDTEGFLDGVPLLLSSGTKSVVTSALQVLEKLAKKEAAKRHAVCLLATGALLHKDETVQTKAAKLIQKWGDATDAELKDVIAPYANGLFSGPKKLLEAFVALEEEVEEPLPAAPHPTQEASLSNHTALPPVTDADELIFLAAQAFDNNQSWHIDLLPAALLRLQNELTEEHIAKLEPALQRALKLYFGDWRSAQGQLDQLLACLFLDVGLWLMQRYPDASRSARELFRGFMIKSEENRKIWEEHGVAVSFLAGWKAEGDRRLYTAHKKLADLVLQRVKEGRELPLLSTPTHAPAWIDPLVLVERFHAYQAQGVVPDDTDLQTALSRCWLHGTEEAVALAKQKLTGEGKALLLFLLDAEQRPAGPFATESAWMAAALAKSPREVYPELQTLRYAQKPASLYTGQLPWQTIVQSYQSDKYNWENGKMRIEKVTLQRKVIQLQRPALSTYAPKESGLKKFFSRFSSKELVVEPPPLVYEYLRITTQWMSTEDRDIRRLFMLTPNNPEPVLALTVDKCLSDPALFGQTQSRFVTEVLSCLHEVPKPLGETGHLFIATCLLSADKTVSAYAAEIWMRAVPEGSVSSPLLGTVLGKHERIEFAPLKRFTDLVLQTLLNVSPAHNRALEDLLVALLKELPEAPVKNMKKLLEIYTELVVRNGSSVRDEGLNILLEKWKANAGLSKALKAVV